MLFCCAPQVRSRPCDLLVRFHRRARLPERQRYPPQRLLPYRHRHPVSRCPAGPTATRATIRTKTEKRWDVAQEIKWVKMGGWMEGKKEEGKEAGRVGRLNYTGVDTEIRKQFSFPAVLDDWQKICSELHLTLLFCLSRPFFLSFMAPKPPHVNTQQHSVSLTAQGQIHTCVWKHSLGGLPGCGQLVAPGWPLAVDSQGESQGPKAGH